MDRATLMILLVLFGAVAFYGFRLARGDRDSEEDAFDAGSAILDFARAFPGEAIRSLHLTADHDAVFVRLYDNRSGFMKDMGNHFACLLLDAKTLHVTPLYSGDGLQVIFDEWPKFSGEYRFKTTEEAADVALWLLASLAPEESASEADTAEQEIEDGEKQSDGELDAGEGIYPEVDEDFEPSTDVEDVAGKPSVATHQEKLGVDPLANFMSGSTKA